MAKFILYFLYKNLTFTLGHFFYAFYCGGTAQTAFDPLYVGLFNTIYTALPCIVLGATDQDISAKGSMLFPVLYEVSMSGSMLNLRLVLLTFLDSIYSAACIFFIHFGTDVFNAGAVELADLRTFSFTLGFTTMNLVTLRVAQATNYWTIWNHITIWGSVLIYWIVTFGFAPLIYALFSVYYEYEDAQYAALNWGPTWLASLSAIILTTIPGLFVAFFLQTMKPSLTDAVREFENNSRDMFIIRVYKALRKLEIKAPGVQDQGEAAMDELAKSLERNESVRKSRRMPKRESTSFKESGTGFGYSHTEGFGDLLTGHQRGSIPPIYVTHM